jgi:hypothetical protein
MIVTTSPCSGEKTSTKSFSKLKGISSPSFATYNDWVKRCSEVFSGHQVEFEVIFQAISS